MSKKQQQKNNESVLEKIIRWIVVGIFAVLPLLYFSGRIASYVTAKQYFLMGTIELLAVLWTWLLLIDKRYRLSKKNMLILALLFLFLVSLTVSALVGVDPTTSFFSTVETGTGLVLFYHIFVFACIITSFIRVRKEKLLKGIMQATLFASVILAVMTFFTGPNGLFEVNSTMLDKSSGGATMGNSLLAGAYFIFSLFFTLILLTKESQAWKKLMYWFGIAVIALSPIYFNVSIFKGAGISSSYFFIGEARIATSALIAGLIMSFFVWLFTRKEKPLSRTIGIAGMVLALVVGGIIIQQIATPNTRINTFFVKESGNRTVDWQTAVKGIGDKPALGWGPENFHVVYQKYLDPIVYDPGRGNEGWSLHAHNNSLEVLVNGGVIGFVFYLAVLVALFAGLIGLYRKGRIDGKTFALLIGMSIAYIVQQQMVYDSITSDTMFFALLGIIAGLSDTTDESRQFGSYFISSSTYVVGTIVAAVMIPIWIYAAYLPARKMEEMFTMSTMPSDQRTALYHHLFNSPGSYAIDTDAEFFTDSIFFAYDAQKENLKANPLYQKISTEELGALIAAVQPSWIDHPYDYHLTLTLLQLENLQYYLTGNAEALKKADEYAVKGFELSTTDPDIYVAYAQTRVYENKIDEAKALLDKAIDLNANYTSAVNFKNSLNHSK